MQSSMHWQWRCWGALSLACGLFWRCWGVAAWYHGQQQQDSDRLITDEGPYLLCRNPRYFGNFWLGLGGCLWAGLPQLTPWFAATWLFIHYPVICFEERTLLRRHGKAFESYCRRTPRFPNAPSSQWLQQIHGLRWDRAFLAEFSTLEGWTLAALLIAGLQGQTLGASLMAGCWLVLRLNRHRRGALAR